MLKIISNWDGTADRAPYYTCFLLFSSYVILRPFMEKHELPDVQPIQDVQSSVVTVQPFNFPMGIDVADGIGLDVGWLERLGSR